ncbi:phosphoenolpyruvate mutase [Paenibacillus sp. FSL R5-0766]|uniref:phosphoenolpyruvate mutase n=1 Tax=unclassified Paenibacillus TaxID=185978 RepID=UPI00096DB3E0|nr:phosphoenolpyruvate mutase [Paenibacillus sp. FSL R5-0765]OMF61055.1 phosphoenolpyruvate mutase [Paenibacillus sp. FSL R5-0765]
MYNKQKKLRDALYSRNIVKVVGAHDALSAIIGEQVGFDAIWASGLGISATHGVPDASILNMTEFLEAAEVMDKATSIPVIADCDTGFGEVNNVKRMITEYERRGIAAVCIEDKLFPKRNSFLAGGQHLADIDEFSTKIEVAKRTQRTEDFMVIARLESFIAGTGLEDALRRARSYTDAGADALLVHSKSKDTEEVFSFSSRWQQENRNVPLIVVPTTYCSVEIEELVRHHYSMVIYANQALRASVSSIQNVLSNIIESGTSRYIEDEVAEVKKVFNLIGTDDLNQTQQWYEGRLVEYRESGVEIPR